MMEKIFFFGGVIFLSAPALAQVDMLKLEIAVSERNRPAVSKIISMGTAGEEIDRNLKSEIRLLLMERLARLNRLEKSARRETAKALIELYPNDPFVIEISENEGVELADTIEAEIDPKVATGTSIQSKSPAPFRIALLGKSAEDLIRLVLSSNDHEKLTVDDRQASLDLIQSYVRPLPASRAESNRDGYKALSTLAPDVAVYATKAATYTKAAEDQRRSILRRMKKKTDDFNGNVFYEHPNTPRYTDTRSYLAIYAGQNNGRSWLRMRLNYTADSWLFVKSASLNIDGKIVYLKYSDWKRDNDGEIWEWIDVPVDDNLRKILTRIMNSKKTIIRFDGNKYYENVTVSAKDKRVIKDMFVVEEVLTK